VKDKEITLKQMSILIGVKLKRISLNIFLACIFSACAATGQAAAITVMSDSPLKPAVAKVVDLFFSKRAAIKIFWCSRRHLP
jgi:hypothetical protein